MWLHLNTWRKWKSCYILKGVSIFLLTYRSPGVTTSCISTVFNGFFFNKKCRYHSPGPSVSTLPSQRHHLSCAAHLSSDSKSCCLSFLKDSSVCPAFLPTAKILSRIRLMIVTSCFSSLYFSVFIRLLYFWFPFFGKSSQFKPIIIFSLSFPISKTCS